MNTPNNAAALERLEQKWRDDAAGCAERRAHGPEMILSQCADELATLRATLTQPDATNRKGLIRRLEIANSQLIGSVDSHNAIMDAIRALANAEQSQMGGEAVLWRAMDRLGRWMYFDHEPTHLSSYEPLYTHPSADAPGQPSGEAGHIPPNVVLALDYSRNFANAKPDIGSTEREHIIGLCGLLERAYTHPSADAPGVAVDEWPELPKASIPEDCDGECVHGPYYTADQMREYALAAMRVRGEQ